MKILRTLATIITSLVLPLSLYAADISGTWTATFDTQIGQQNYTYEFKATGTELTGSVKSGNGEATIEDGKIAGDDVSFTEHMTYQGTALTIKYTGKVVSPDEIDFTRKVGEFATEQLVAKRVNPPNAPRR